MGPNTKLWIYIKHCEISFVITCCKVFNVWSKTALLLPVWTPLHGLWVSLIYYNPVHMQALIWVCVDLYERLKARESETNMPMCVTLSVP